MALRHRPARGHERNPPTSTPRPIIQRIYDKARRRHDAEGHGARLADLRTRHAIIAAGSIVGTAESPQPAPPASGVAFVALGCPGGSP